MAVADAKNPDQKDPRPSTRILTCSKCAAPTIHKLLYGVYKCAICAFRPL